MHLWAHMSETHKCIFTQTHLYLGIPLYLCTSIQNTVWSWQGKKKLFDGGHHQGKHGCRAQTSDCIWLSKDSDPLGPWRNRTSAWNPRYSKWTNCHYLLATSVWLRDETRFWGQTSPTTLGLLLWSSSLNIPSTPSAPHQGVWKRALIQIKEPVSSGAKGKERKTLPLRLL